MGIARRSAQASRREQRQRMRVQGQRRCVGGESGATVIRRARSLIGACAVATSVCIAAQESRISTCHAPGADSAA
jgi:hypothetical protein